jgi:phosphomannomutase
MIDAMGFDAITRTRIGSPYVIEGIEAALAANPAARVVGYEANGGFLTGYTVNGPVGALSPLLTRDAFLPILCALAGIAQHGPLAAQIDALPPRRTAADRMVGLPTESSAALIAELRSDSHARDRLFATMGDEAGIDLTDGLRVTFTSGEIAHLRPSGNAPELRCYAEAATEARALEIVRAILADITARYA